MAKIIYLDPGHGGSDPGAVNGTRRESDDNLRLALAVQSKLAAQGQTAVLTRQGDMAVTLAARTTAANQARADMFVSLHRNAYIDATANGVEVWVYTTAGVAETAAAAEVLERIAGVGVQRLRGVFKGNYHVCRETNMHAMLVELGFVTNAEDNRLFDKNLEAYAEAIARGICEALGEIWREGGATSPSPLYRVQVGAFRNKSYAEAFLTYVKGKGLNAFLVETGDAEDVAGPLYRVQVGAFRVKQNSEDFLAEVKAKGLDAFIIQAEI